MVHTDYDQERSKYDQLISEKEDQISELGDKKRKMEDAIIHLEDDLQRGFSELRRVHDECARDGDAENFRMQQVDEEQAYVFGRDLKEANEQLSAAYNTEARRIEQQTEELYEKRGEIPWD